MRITMKAARVNANLSQATAAKALNIGLKTLQNWESGVTFPRADRLKEICALYGCNLEDIIFLPNNHG